MSADQSEKAGLESTRADDDPIRVLIADDHPIVRQGLANLLEVQSGIDVLGAAENGEQALAMAEADPPDVVLMDLMMPGMDGVETTRRMLEVCPSARVIVLTSHHEDAMVFPAISAGALSYLLKSAAPAELIDAVRAAARGEARLSPRWRAGSCRRWADAAPPPSRSRLASWKCCASSRAARTTRPSRRHWRSAPRPSRRMSAMS